ncbi:GAF domain-containing protein [Sporosarcina trichiuri]|uniref:GAF domain-containing protein n=1 Tax=Sporosarcina trichiuri TaxID=3056445 RepID=UPI0025B61B8D|nr:GAF domain-containing protein [Sporosarcina sp. 0.2-SM1T-5]WJY27954.1 GAF domain-containing protein [Sporosarcina sp. 0.2-SM1T-5]
MFMGIEYSKDLSEAYTQLSDQLNLLLDGEPNRIANLSNASALLSNFLDRTNWTGFYLMEEGELVLGPFQGLPACIRIAVGKGVCGTAAEKQETIVVEDVNAFPGHIACDAASQSEIVVPLVKDGQLIGVLDIDSPETGRFSDEDRAGIEKFAATLLRHI